MHINTLTEAFYVFNLQLFADGAGGADGASAAETAPVAGEQAAVEAQVAAEQTEAPVDLEAEFDDLVKGKFKDVFAQRSKSMIDDRTKNLHKELNEAKKKYSLVAQSVADLYGLDSIDDAKALVAEIDKAERPGLEERAFKNGVDEDMQKYIDKLERQNKRAERIEREQQEEAERQAFWADKFAQAEQLKEQFPGFDFDAEMRGTTEANKLFQSLIANGASVESAFKAAHFDDLQRGALEYAAKRIEKGVLEKARANGSRPSENGTSAASAITTRVNLDNITLDEMDALAEKVRRGERVTL